jgi:hypothetical protein
MNDAYIDVYNPIFKKVARIENQIARYTHNKR